MPNRIDDFLKLIRWDKPIGTLLLLWPTLTALWLASNGRPQATTLFVFICGVFLTRAAGCILNDCADRKFDGRVKRTEERPLAAGKISLLEALTFCSILLLAAFLLLLLLNKFTIIMAIIGCIMTPIYPFLKRITNLPQVGLGIAFNWGILMAFTAEQNHLPPVAILFYLAGILITIAYDTMYGLVDKEDDLKIGLKSTAIFFGDKVRIIIAIMQLTALVLLLIIGLIMGLNAWYYGGLLAWILLICYQQFLIKDSDSDKCFKAFLNNNWSWLMVFLGVILAYL